MSTDRSSLLLLAGGLGMRVLGWLKEDLETTVCSKCADFETDAPVTELGVLEVSCSICGKLI